MTLSDSLKSLLLSPEFARIQQDSKRFKLFDVLGIRWRELSHSDLLAWMLNPKESHATGSVMLKAFLHAAYQEANGIITFNDYLNWHYEDARILREDGRIDLTIEFSTSKMVIGIENKIWAGESEKQLERYQQHLVDNYQSWNKHLLFLTPAGIDSVTHKAESDKAVDKCQYLPISYRCVLTALEAGRNMLSSGEVSTFLNMAIHHIKEDIMNDGEIKNIVTKLWHNLEYAPALKSIIQHRPSIEDYKKEYESIITIKLTEKGLIDFYFESYPKKGKIREIKLFSDKWKNQKLNFCLMFYWYPDDPEPTDKPTVRVFLYTTDYPDKEQARINQFLKQNPDKFLPDARPIKHWTYWNDILVEDFYRLSHDSTDAGIAEMAALKALEYFDLLNDAITSFTQK
jgi:hypothetical protein